VIPATVTGLVVFLASVGPGYLYVRLVERWRPYRERTALREAAEIVVSGSLATLLGVVVASLVADAISLLDREDVLADPARHLLFEPARVALFVTVVLVVSYGLAFVMGRYSPGRGAEVFPDSGWYSAFERGLPQRHGIVATVELDNGRAVAGVVRAFTAEPTPVDDRELILAAPPGQSMLVRDTTGQVQELVDQFLVVRGDQVRYITGTCKPLQSA